MMYSVKETLSSPYKLVGNISEQNEPLYSREDQPYLHNSKKLAYGVLVYQIHTIWLSYLFANNSISNNMELSSLKNIKLNYKIPEMQLFIWNSTVSLLLWEQSL